ncbi:MAG: hypothetical protein K8S62_12355 [Candidatus Sabulitectum sp.]|nr:hypothetical protein [Candidatus Sabulitectum sp.]
MKVFIIFLLVTGILFAESDYGYISSGGTSSPPQPADGTLYEQPYDFPNLANAIYVHGPSYGGADNFTFTSEATVKSITFWMVFSSSAHPFDIAVDIYENTGGTFGSHIWGETVPGAYQTETLTGDQSWGFDLYQSDLQLQDYPAIPAGDYWLAMSVLGSPDNAGWLVCDPTYPPNMKQYNGSWTTVNYDGWFGLYDHDVALSRTTWADIKTTF